MQLNSRDYPLNNFWIIPKGLLALLWLVAIV